MRLSALTSILVADWLPMHDLRRSERNSGLQVDLEDLQHHLLKMYLQLACHRLMRLIHLIRQERTNLAFMAVEQVQHRQ